MASQHSAGLSRSGENVEPDLADEVGMDQGDNLQRELGVPASGNKGVLPTFKGRSATSTERKEALRKQYEASLQKQQQNGLDQGFRDLKQRSRARKYLAQVMQRKLETHVSNILWEETHQLDIDEEYVHHAQREYEESGKALLREAERVIFEHERLRVKQAQQNAVEKLDTVVPIRRRKRYLAWLIFVLSVTFLSSIHILRRAAGTKFRKNIAAYASLNDTANLEAWMDCDDPFGVMIDFRSSDEPVAYCDSTSANTDYYLYNLTNAYEVAFEGAKPIVVEAGPYSFIERIRKRLVSSETDTVEVERVPYFEFTGDDAELDEEITVPNMGYFQLVSMLTLDAGLDDFDALLIPWLAAIRLQSKLLEYPEINATSWFTESNSTDCWTFGCFLYNKKFTTLVTIFPNATERGEIIDKFFESIPVFGHSSYSNSQIEALWSLFATSTEYISEDDDGNPVCLFDSTSFCNMTGPAVSNKKLIIDDFLSLWAYNGDEKILTTQDRLRLSTGIQNGTLQSFYDQIWTRDATCKSATEDSASLLCTQLNDLAQYLFWLYQTAWFDLAASRDPAKGAFIKTTPRQVLITGYADLCLALANGVMGTSPSVLDQAPSRSDFPRGIFEGSYNTSTLSASDLLWLQSAWVPGIIQGASNFTVKFVFDALNMASTGASVYVLPDSYILAPNSSYGNVLSLESRTYLTGETAPEYTQDARFMQAINDKITVRYFGETSLTQGRDQWLQFSPTLDIMWTGVRMNVNGLAFSESSSVAAWEDPVPVWLDEVYRPASFTRKSVLSKYGSVDVDLLRFGLQYDRIKRYELDRSSNYSTTCMVNIAPYRDNLPLWVGYPNYLTCNATNGAETPSTRNDDSTDTSLTYDDIENQQLQNTDTTTDVDYDLVPEDESPLPLDERAKLVGLSTEMSTNTSMNLIDIEPVSGATAGFSLDLGLYVQLQAMPTLLPDALTVKLPYYASKRKRTMPSSLLDALSSSIARKARQMRAVSWLGSIVASSTLTLTVLVLYRTRGSPEIKAAQVRPVDDLEEEATVQLKRMQKDERIRLRELKAKHAVARQKLQNARLKLQREVAGDVEKLFRVDTTKRGPPKKLQRGARNKKKTDVVYGIARDGDVFMFTNEEMRTLAETYGNPLEHLADDLSANEDQDHPIENTNADS